MKTIKSISLLAIAICFALFMTSCGEHDHEGHDHDGDATHTHAVHGETTAYTSAYVCPMHCEGSGAAEAGDCPVCGMDYVALGDHTKDGHKHDE